MGIMGITERLAQFVVETAYQDIAPEVLRAAKRAMLDTLGVMLAGSREPVGKAITSFVRGMGGRPRAVVVGAGFRTSPTNAALANGTMGHALDYDDVFWATTGHPSVVLLPSVFAIGENSRVSGKVLLEAFILGFEIGCRLASAGMEPRLAGFHPTAIYGSIGAAVAGAKVLGLGVEETRMVLGLAASHASGLGRNRGTMTKPYHAGNAARSGVIAALLVKHGFTAAKDLLEGSGGFCAAFGGDVELQVGNIADKLGSPYLIVSPGVSVKKYPTCFATHRCIDAVLQLINSHQFMADDVTEVECQTGTMIRDILVFDEPVTYLQAKFSMQFCVAIALLERNVGLLQVTDEKVNEPKVRQLMKRVRLCYVDQPLAQSDTVKVRLYDGRQYCVSVRKPKGDYELPLTDEEIVSKYRDCAGAVLPKNQVEKSLELILNLEQLEHTNELADVVANIDT